MQIDVKRPSGRLPQDMRPIRFERGYTCHAEGSVLVCFGLTKVICTASIGTGVPGFLRGKGQGWLTAEYGMLPRSTGSRMDREATRGKQSGRTIGIQRLIGRSLRGALDLSLLGERTLTVDCDVIQADGGTRTAAITGAWVALSDCLAWMRQRNLITGTVLKDNVAAISCGIYQGTAVLDLDYDEDSAAETDANFVMTGAGGIVEIQGTAEQEPFTEDELKQLLELARAGIGQLVSLQNMAIM